MLVFLQRAAPSSLEGGKKDIAGQESSVCTPRSRVPEQNMYASLPDLVTRPSVLQGQPATLGQPFCRMLGTCLCPRDVLGERVINLLASCWQNFPSR